MAVLYTDKGSDGARWLFECCLYFCGSKDLCGEFRSSVSQDSSRSRSFPRSIAASLTVIYSFVAGVVPKGDRRQRNASSSTIAMHVTAVVIFSCIQR